MSKALITSSSNNNTQVAHASSSPPIATPPPVIVDTNSVETVSRVATAMAAAGGGVLQLHLHQDRTYVHAPTTTTTPSLANADADDSRAMRRRHGSRPVGVGTVMGQCCECGKPVVDEGTADQLQYVCARQCGGVVWHVPCAQHKLATLRNGVKEIIHTCDRCHNQLNIRSVVDAPVRYDSPTHAIGAWYGNRLLGWLCYVLGELYILWPFRVAWITLRLLYYTLRFPFVFFFVLPYVSGVLAKLAMYVHSTLPIKSVEVKSHGTSLFNYHFEWRDSKTQEIGVESRGLRYDVGHWLFGFSFQVFLLTCAVLLYVVYRVAKILLWPVWYRVRFQPTVRVMRTTAAPGQ